MSQQSNNCAIAVIGIDIGKSSFHVVGHDQRGRSCCDRNGRAAKSRRDLPTCHRA
jgi:hypothetical protein